jgi:hypothetical protein
MASTFDASSIEKLNGNTFHAWKMKMESLLHEKDLWEITLGNYYTPKLNLERLFLKEVLEHCLFMKKEKLVHGTVFLNVINFLLHYVACTKIAKDVWDNFCATFEKRHMTIIASLNLDLVVHEGEDDGVDSVEEYATSCDSDG